MSSLPTTTPLIEMLEDERNTICQIDNIFSLYSHLVYCTVVPVIFYNFYKLITVSVAYSVNIKNDIICMLDSYKIALDCVCMQFQCPFSHQCFILLSMTIQDQVLSNLKCRAYKCSFSTL